MCLLYLSVVLSVLWLTSKYSKVYVIHVNMNIYTPCNCILDEVKSG